MAEITVPGRAATPVLDRPLLPAAVRRLAALAVQSELAAYAGIVLLGFILRIWDVGSRAMHHDESLHAYYAWKFFVGQGYHYDPMMHGPLQFEVVPIFYLLFGVSEFSARLLAVTLGSALVFLPYFLRRHITRPGALLAALFLAISPAMVYFSRFIRDDIYLACFSLILFIALVGYLESHRPYLLYIAAAAAALAMASMEAAYLTFFIFGTFLLFEGLRERLAGQPGPVLAALKATSVDTALTALSLFAVILVLLFSTFFTNPYGVWDSQHALCLSQCFSLHPQFNPARTDILGGLAYWQIQHGVQRGGQPWFYYFLLLPLYEQIAVLFGVAGAAYAVTRRTLVGTFLVWWAAMALALYSWAGEKMPWLSIHITLPLLLLAGLFLGAVVNARSLRLTIAVAAAFLPLLALEIHSTFVLNYVDGANPTEMLIYVQTSQDVPQVSNEIKALSRRLGGTTMPIGLDNADVGGWPFIWYLRDYSAIYQTNSFGTPACNGQWCPVLLMLGPEYDQYSAQLASHYVVQKYRWNWWFPEDYKDWFPAHWGAVLAGQAPLAYALGTPTDWSHIWAWLVYRRPFGPRDARWLYFLVRRDLVPGAKYYHAPSATLPAQPPAMSNVTSLRSQLIAALGSTGVGRGQLDGPRGLGAGANGTVAVADTLNHRVVLYSAAGKTLRVIGGPGTGPGRFSLTDSPQAAAVGPNGDIYVADTWNQRIEVFAPNGRLLRMWGGGPIGSGPGQFYGPRSIAVSPGGHVYVADTGNKRIQVFAGSGRYLFSIGSAGTGPGQFEEPSSVALGPKGTVYVADFWNQRIQELTAGGRFLRSWAVADWAPHTYDEPYLAVDQRSGDVYASDPSQQRVLVFTGTGRAIGAFGSTQVSLPIGVAALPSGEIAVSDASANHVDLFKVASPAGAPPGRVPMHERTKP